MKNKKQVKIIALAIVAFFLLGVVGIAVSQTSRTYAASSASASNIGVVNHQLLVQQHPDMAQAQQTMKDELDKAKKEFDDKSSTMNDKEKQDYYTQLQQRLSLKQQELIGAIYDKVDAAVKAVADSKGITVVLDKNNVVYGGQDITDDVSKKLAGK